MADDLLLKGLSGAGLAGLNLQQDALRASQLQKTAAQKMDPNKPGADLKQKEIESAAQQVEGMLLKQMLASMWNTVPKDGMISGSNEEEQYRDMLHQAYADDLSKGQGLGIKQVIIREMQRREKG